MTLVFFPFLSCADVYIKNAFDARHTSADSAGHARSGGPDLPNVGGSQVADDSGGPSPQKWRRTREEGGRFGKGSPRARTCSKTWSILWRHHLPCWDCTCLDHRSLDRKLEIVSPCTLLSLQCVATCVHRSVGRLQCGPTPLPTQLRTPIFIRCVFHTKIWCVWDNKYCKKDKTRLACY